MSLDYAMSVPFKSSPVEFNQHLLFPSSIFDLLPKDHDCFLYANLFQQIDTSRFESLYSVKGQHAYHPKLIVAILIFTYSQGDFSSRKIEKRCHEDLSFMFIAQMNCPNFRVLSDFRKDHGDFFQDCFKQTVKLALALKLASLGHSYSEFLWTPLPSPTFSLLTGQWLDFHQLADYHASRTAACCFASSASVKCITPSNRSPIPPLRQYCST